MTSTAARQLLGSGRSTTVPLEMVMDNRYGKDHFLKRHFGGPDVVYFDGRNNGQTVNTNLVSDSTWAVENYTDKVKRETKFPNYVELNAEDFAGGSMAPGTGQGDMFKKYSGGRSFGYGANDENGNDNGNGNGNGDKKKKKPERVKIMNIDEKQRKNNYILIIGIVIMGIISFVINRKLVR